MQELLTAEELAVRLKVRPETVKAWARSGRIPVIRFSRKVLRFDIEAVSRTIAERGRSGEAER
ncbi:MAG TPA: helix-turn-helix domain-containing protein [Phycisphaerae bacterium]|nr:helix-turn-helix domain-containing protein [Phycisphaerae bacterium]